MKGKTITVENCRIKYVFSVDSVVIPVTVAEDTQRHHIPQTGFGGQLMACVQR
jgi:hypothetical protein